MRVFLLANEFSDYTNQLANALCNKKIQVMVVRSDSIYASAEQNDTLSEGVSCYSYKKPRLYSPMNIIILYRLLKHIRQYNPDIIHSQGMPIWFSSMLPIIRLMKYPLIVTFHDPKPHIGESYMRTRLANFLARKYASRSFVHGTSLKELMITEYAYPEWRTCVIASGEHEVMPFTRYSSDAIGEDNHTILFFGRIYAYKGLEYLIRAEPLITREIPDLKIIIAGKGESFEKYRSMIVHPEHFQIHNYHIPYAEGAIMFQKCCIVVLPYVDASQSGVVHTAYGFKKPVIATAVGAIPEIVDNGVTGLIIPPRDPGAIARAVIMLLKDDEFRREMGEQGYRKLKTDLSWDRIVTTMIPVYERVRQESSSR